VIPLGAADVTLGRAPDSTIVLDDDYASNQHAKLSLVNGTWVVSDLGSTNGTWIDRQRIVSPTQLQVGHQLKVGRTVLELRR
jgi:pSer/pThr/pTyr-binding forkhead associated (FHA) protein